MDPCFSPDFRIGRCAFGGFIEDSDILGGWAEPIENVVPSGQEVVLRIPDDLVVEGTVLGPSGEPVGGAEVLLRSDGYGSSAQGTSDTRGHFRLEFSPDPKATFRIEVEAEVEGPGLLVGTLQDVQPGAMDLKVRLHRK